MRNITGMFVCLAVFSSVRSARASAILQYARAHRRPHPRCLRKHERQAVEQGSAHRRRQAFNQRRGVTRSSPDAIEPAVLRCTVSCGAKNCQDTSLVVPFGPAESAGNAIAASIDAAQAQGYTPIAFALEHAAQDLPEDATERVIVLVSDGKETCQGDPVVVAKSLVARGITIPAVGFIADTAARMQLQAIRQRPEVAISTRRSGRNCPSHSNRSSTPVRRLSSPCRRSRSPASCARQRPAGRTTSSMPRPASVSTISQMSAPR
jgi:hypothetical protein